ncbi:hypothetical protein QJS10_CPB19g01555 [Acorus calamus]|uniref:Uncharacterized protein n=1 Tax=Acorus calamus TaxID=4465 RepID=A0AAV9CER6_ACOCL|nr:hypothetical protein QJS10_CPB19g01555 [Acorus calamus]
MRQGIRNPVSFSKEMGNLSISEFLCNGDGACSPRRDLSRSVPGVVPNSSAGVPTCCASPLAFAHCESPESVSDSVSVCGDCSAGLRSVSYRNGSVSASDFRVRSVTKRDLEPTGE